MTYRANGDYAGWDRFGRATSERRTNTARTTDLDRFPSNDSWQVLEERADGVPGEQYLWDIRYIDAPVLRWRDADANPATGLEEKVYYTNDANMNVTALVDASSANVVERYVYTPYGEATVLDVDWSQVTNNESAVANEVMYCGYGFDAETGMYVTDTRIYDPGLGRWLQRDIPYIDGMNLYQYCDANPCDATDPTGLASSSGQSVWDRLELLGTAALGHLTGHHTAARFMEHFWLGEGADYHVDASWLRSRSWVQSGERELVDEAAKWLSSQIMMAELDITTKVTSKTSTLVGQGALLNSTAPARGLIQTGNKYLAALSSLYWEPVYAATGTFTLNGEYTATIQKHREYGSEEYAYTADLQASYWVRDKYTWLSEHGAYQRLERSGAAQAFYWSAQWSDSWQVSGCGGEVSVDIEPNLPAVNEGWSEQPWEAQWFFGH